MPECFEEIEDISLLSNLTPVKKKPDFETDAVAKVCRGNFLPLLQAKVG